jgi:hypothetical protein
MYQTSDAGVCVLPQTLDRRPSNTRRKSETYHRGYNATHALRWPYTGLCTRFQHQNSSRRVTKVAGW